MRRSDFAKVLDVVGRGSYFPQMENNTPPIPDLHERRARIFKALGHPVRMAIIDRLSAAGGGELCVCEFKDDVGVGLPALSKHLAVLKEAGVVGSRRRGTFVHYRLEMRCVERFLACVDSFVDHGAHVRALDDYRKPLSEMGK
jgi:ArsR family transcriptional regulator